MVGPILVDPKLSRLKFDREVKKLFTISSELRRKGWIIEKAEYPVVRVTFLTKSVKPIIVPLTVDIDFTNYNVLPLSVRFLDPLTFEPTTVIGIQNVNGTPRNIIISKHPETNNSFFCMAGVQEYHSHPQHDGDSWDIYRYTEKGDLVYILDKIWLYCVSGIKAFQIPPFTQLQIVFEAM